MKNYDPTDTLHRQAIRQSLDTRGDSVVKANSAEKVFFSSDRFLHWAILLINRIEGTPILKLAMV